MASNNTLVYYVDLGDDDLLRVKETTVPVADLVDGHQLSSRFLPPWEQFGSRIEAERFAHELAEDIGTTVCPE